MTTNCISEPKAAYKDRIWTTGEVGWPGVGHLEGKPGQTKDHPADRAKARGSGGGAGWAGGLGVSAVGLANRPGWREPVNRQAPVRHRFLRPACGIHR